MTEYSYPVVEQPLPASQWSSITKGIGNGILDETGFPYKMVFPSDANATNTVTIVCPDVENKRYGHAILEGFYHKYDADITLTVPAVTVSTLYHIALMYDPLNTASPVTMRVLTSPLSYNGGKNYLHLYTIRREPNQLLTNATVRMLRPRVAPVMVVASEDDLPRAYKTLLGTIAIIHNGIDTSDAVIKMAMAGDTDESVLGWFWKTIYDPNADNRFTWSERANTPTYTSPGAGGTFKRAIGRSGKKRALRGTVSFTNGGTFNVNGNGGNGYSLFSGEIGAADAPAKSQIFIVSTSGTNPPGFARLVVNPAGEIYAFPNQACSWISLDGVQWEVA